MAELVDALDLGSSAARRGGSSPPLSTNLFVFIEGLVLDSVTMGEFRLKGLIIVFVVALKEPVLEVFLPVLEKPYLKLSSL